MAAHHVKFVSFTSIFTPSFQKCFLPMFRISTHQNLPLNNLYSYLSHVRGYASKKGNKKKIMAASFDSNVAEGIVDVEKLTSSMETELDKLRHAFKNSITTRISTAFFDNIKIMSGKRKTSLGNVAIIQNNDDKYILDLASSPNLTLSVMKTLNDKSIFSPTLEGNKITVTVPRLTIEVRQDLVKSAKSLSEEAKIGIRKVRQKGMNDIRKQRKEISQDDARMLENHIQFLTDNYVKQVDDLLQEKSKELLLR
ncbi:ribosome-recycling factor-like [Xenia sp. Carnegie-2017]|uniref:ribosome-recycling factor-like n=1 Tax=Xenia sp. Carnegie-2017 TaxID=2897299 RepID=UPI001F04BADF|nr:ribosome-recycling factor-like [Xenia sp. Carnegie-2017]